MLLKTDTYTFWVDFFEDEISPGTYIYLVGKRKNKTRPCIELMVKPCEYNDSHTSKSGTTKETSNHKKVNVIIQNLEYYETCAKERLVQKSGTVDMIYAILKVLLHQYKVNKIILTDKSYWRGPNGPVPLPE